MTGPTGRRRVPFHEYVFKVHQRCNLSCDYCYVYTLGDTTWRERPALMSPEIWRAAAHRMREHAERYGLTATRIVLHGGEPLLAGVDTLRTLAEDVRGILGEACRPSFVLQTNGTLLDERTLDALLEARISVGVSLDGTPEQNDRHRVRADGQGSSEAVRRALDLLGDTRYRSAFAGILCTVDPRNEPVAVYEELLGFQPPAIDFLLPHANWARPPLRPPGAGPTPYGDWLVSIFDRWYDAPKQETSVLVLVDILTLVLGGASRSEQVGLSPVAVAVIESDGAIEQVDSLRSAYPGACATGLNVLTDPLDAALDHPGIRLRQLGVEALSPICRACHLHPICGGGHYAHRYRPENGFVNPSVYCADLIRIIEHVRGRVSADLQRRLERSPA